MTDLEDAIAGGNAGQRDEADHGSHRETDIGYPHRRDAADQCQGDIGHDDGGQHGRLIARIQDEEDHQQRNYREPGDQSGRLFLGLKLALEADEIPGWQACGVDDFADASDNLTHVAAIGIGVNDDATSAVLAPDLVRPIAFLDRGDARKRQAPGGRIDQSGRKILRASARIGQAQHQVIAALPVDDLGTMGAIGEHLQQAQGFSWRQARCRYPALVQAHRDLGNQDLLFNRQIDQARHAGQSLAHLFSQAAQSIGVVTEDFQRDLCAYA